MTELNYWISELEKAESRLKKEQKIGVGFRIQQEKFNVKYCKKMVKKYGK